MTSEQAQAARKALDQFDRIEKQIKLLAEFLAEAEDIRKRNGSYDAIQFVGEGMAEGRNVACRLVTHAVTHPDLKRFSAHVAEGVVTMATVELHRLERVRDAIPLPGYPGIVGQRPF